MRRLMKFLGGLLLGVVLLFGIWYLIASQGWLPRLSDEQKGAVALMAQPLDFPDGENALVTLELIRFDVPEDEYPRWQQHGPVGLHEALLETGHNVLSARAGQAQCATATDSCLSVVMEDPGAAVVILEEAEPVASRLPRFYSAAYASITASEKQPSLTDDLPPLQMAGNLGELEAAVAFVGGDVSGAISKACMQAEFWRRMARNTDSLVVQILGYRYALRAGEMINGMLVEVGGNAKLPEDCLAVFRPLVRGERSLCNAMHGEQAYVSSTETLWAEGKPAWAPRLNQGHFLALSASNYARYCEQDTQPDGQSEYGLANLECSWSEHVFDPLGCYLFEAGQPDFSTYLHRLVDYSVNLELLGAALIVNSRSPQQTQAEALSNSLPDSLADRYRLETTAEGATTLTVAAGTFQPQYRFQPLPLRDDELPEDAGN